MFLVSEVHSKPTQTSNMELFVKIIICWKESIIFIRSSILDIWLASEHASELLRKKCPYSELFWSAFSRIYSVSLRIQSECGKMRTRLSPNTNTFHPVWLGFYKNNVLKCLNLTGKIRVQSVKVSKWSSILFNFDN